MSSRKWALVTSIVALLESLLRAASLISLSLTLSLQVGNADATSEMEAGEFRVIIPTTCSLDARNFAPLECDIPKVSVQYLM